MITKIQVPIPAKIEERDDKRICDICKKQTYAHSRNWQMGRGFDVETVEIKMDIGASYPVCSHGEQTIYDICPECFKNKLMPFLQTLGAEPRIKEYDY